MMPLLLPEVKVAPAARATHSELAAG